MPQWGMQDAADDAVITACSSFNLHTDQATLNLLYANGQVEAVTSDNISTRHAAHTGWVVTTRGTGGRAGRVFREVLVAGQMQLLPAGYGFVTVNNGADRVVTTVDGITYYVIAPTA